MGFHNLVNTQYFSEAALAYKKNGDIYTKAPAGTRDYYDFWELHEKRCLEGYQVGDTWITGRHYFYLNFTPIFRVPEEDLVKAMAMYRAGKEANITSEKELLFPKFWEIDYEWWTFKHIAWYGGSFMGINSPGGRHLCALKTRGAGFSYKEAADAVYNFTFIDGSKSYFFAGAEEYLVKDGILTKVNDMLSFMETACPYWAQNRQKKSTLMHQRASWVDDMNREHGTKSEIIGVTVDKNPNKTRGKRGRKIVFEEAGSFPKLKEALEISQGSIKSGSFYVGQISVFGTGGEEGPGIEGLDEVYNNPETWDMLSFPNIYDGLEGTECGYFVPCWRANEATFDENGNVDVELAIKLDNIERAKKRKSKDPKALDRRKAEYPRNASEALMRVSFNMFNIAEIDAQMRRISSNQVIQGYLRNGTLISGEKGPQFVPLPDANPILHYPHKNSDDLTGCLTVFEKPLTIPYFNEANEQVTGTPPDMYFIVVDPVYKEDADDLTSLFCVKVWKQYNNIDPVNQGLPIAWYTCRPKSLRNAYKMLFLMADWYNCNIQSEIAGGGQGIIDYARETHQMHKIEYDVSIDNKEIMLNDTRKNRSYFMNINEDKKLLGLRYYADYTMEIRGVNEHNQPIRNIHCQYDIAELREMRKYDGKRNADRISTSIIAMFMLKKKALEQAIAEEVKSNAGFFNRPLFSDNFNQQVRATGVTTAY